MPLAWEKQNGFGARRRENIYTNGITISSSVEMISCPSKRKETLKLLIKKAPRVAIQITEIAVDTKKKTRRRQSVAHLTVTNLSGDEARKLIIKAIQKAGGR